MKMDENMDKEVWDGTTIESQTAKALTEKFSKLSDTDYDTVLDMVKLSDELKQAGYTPGKQFTKRQLLVAIDLLEDWIAETGKE